MQTMKKTAFFLCLFAAFSSFAQSYKQANASETYHDLLKTKTVGSVLYIAAHPDDENTKLITYLANERRLRTGYLSLTRGDGGQNLVGPEQGPALGIIRTNELLKARQTDGGEQFFTRAYDFGFSKSPQETFQHWNKDSVLHDVVWVIRQFKPDVIICRFPTTGEGGHGHHTASAILAEEAFEAAADPNRFPDQLKYVSTWQARRLFWNTFNFGGGMNTTDDSQLKVNVGLYNQYLGKSYGEIAATSRSMHKSQGFGSASSREENIEYFKLIKGEPAFNDPFEQIDQSWKRLSGLSKIEKSIQKILNTYDFKNPSASIQALVQLKKDLNIALQNEKNELNKHYLQLTKKRVEDLIFSCAGIYIESTVAKHYAVPRTMITLKSSIINRSEAPVYLNKVVYLGNEIYTSAGLKKLRANQEVKFDKQVLVKDSTAISAPFWLSEGIKNDLFAYQHLDWIGRAKNVPSQYVSATFTIFGETFTRDIEILSKSVDPIRGEIFRPMEVLPPASIQFEQKSYYFPLNVQDTIYVIVKANTKSVKGTFTVNMEGYWDLKIPNSNFELINEGDEVKIPIYIKANKRSPESEIQLKMTINFREYDKSIYNIAYDHIPNQFFTEKCVAKIIPVNYQYTPSKIAYIKGSGDLIPEFLTALNYPVDVIESDNLDKVSWKNYKAVITGVRAYNVHEKLFQVHPELMNYVNEGGNLIVQYNTNSRFGPLKGDIGPYPFEINRNRVTEENASVRFVDSTARILTYPNVIKHADFDGWIQERGIYFAENLDPAYQTVLGMHDTDENEQLGSLIIGKYGKGTFIYTGLAFFRQVPYGHLGASKLFINLIHQNDK